MIITNKDEFIDFVRQLANEGFSDMALNYLDAASSAFGDDQDIYALYHSVRGRKK